MRDSAERFGPYEIVSPIGAGGMGEVWRARDTRLDRSVAIKILPADFGRNAQLRLRFARLPDAPADARANASVRQQQPRGPLDLFVAHEEDFLERG